MGGWVVQKSLKTPLRNIKMAPYQYNNHEYGHDYLFADTRINYIHYVNYYSKASLVQLSL